jgi:hypothetical protein
MQSNWIGRSTGVRFAFPHAIRDDAGVLVGDGRMYVFTTRADTIMGVTFVAVAPEHPLAAVAAARDPAIAAFVDEAKHGSVMEADMATMEKNGVPTGLFVNHPLTGAQVGVGRQLRADDYGDGAVMGVPAHDERDFAFARKYGLPIRQVVDVKGQAFSDPPGSRWYEDKAGGVCVHSGKYDGLAYEAAVDAIAADLAARGLGEKKTQWRLRDWGISRQRYWGTPIPIIHCDTCGPVPVPYDRPAGGAARRPGARRQRQSAEQGRAFLSCRARSAASPRGARPTRWTPSSIRPGTTCATARPTTTRADGRCAQRLLDADGPVHRRHRACGAAPVVRALLDQGDARHHAADLPGNPERGLVSSTSRSPGCCARAWC